MVPGIKLLNSPILEAIQIFSIDVKHLSAANQQRDGAKPNTVIPYIPQIDSWGARASFNNSNDAIGGKYVPCDYIGSMKPII